MRWKIRPSGHDPRQIDLLAALAIVIAVVVVGHYLIVLRSRNKQAPSSCRANPCAGDRSINPSHPRRAIQKGRTKEWIASSLTLLTMRSRHSFAISPRTWREFCLEAPTLQSRAQGMPGAWPHPQPRMRNEGSIRA